MSRIDEARQFCIDAHAGQTRAGGAAYSQHPIQVMETLRDLGITDEDVLVAALLHDVVEDTDHPLGTIRERFGDRVATFVNEMTLHDSEYDGFEEKHRKLAEHARRMSPEAKLIKLSDRLSNLVDLHARPEKKRDRYAKATRTLLEALSPWPAEGDPLASRIGEYTAKYDPR